MNKSEFSQALQRGLGSAIIELKEHPDSTIHREVLLSCCLRDLTFDWQSESSKGYYLYDAIVATGEPDFFLQPIIDRFLSRCPDGLFRQLAALLYCCAEDKNQDAIAALHSKYDCFAAKQGRLTKNKTVDEGMQWDEVAFHLLYIDGFTAFKKYAVDAGTARLKYPDKRDSYDDWYRRRAEKKFGEKRIDEYYAKEYRKSTAIQALVETMLSDEVLYEQKRTLEKQTPLTIDALRQAATTAAADKNPRLKMFELLGRRHFSFGASEQDLIELAQAALNEENKTAKALLLSQFFLVPFPLDITPLIEYAQSDNTLLAEAAIERLREFKDKRLHELAIQLLTDKGLSSFATTLLKENYQRSDDAIILAALKKSSCVPHRVQQDIANIYRHHRSADAFPILFHSYQNGDCSFCRFGIVEAMRNCRVATDAILEECLYDSNDDIRRYVKRILSRKPKPKPATTT